MRGGAPHPAPPTPFFLTSALSLGRPVGTLPATPGMARTKCGENSGPFHRAVGHCTGSATPPSSGRTAIVPSTAPAEHRPRPGAWARRRLEPALRVARLREGLTNYERRATRWPGRNSRSQAPDRAAALCHLVADLLENVATARETGSGSAPIPRSRQWSRAGQTSTTLGG